MEVEGGDRCWEVCPRKSKRQLGIGVFKIVVVMYEVAKK